MRQTVSFFIDKSKVLTNPSCLFPILSGTSIVTVSASARAGVGGLTSWRKNVDASDQGGNSGSGGGANKHEDDSLCGPSHSELPRRYAMPEEQRLLFYLLHGYSHAVRPVNDSNLPVQMNLGITLAQVLDMDEKNQILVSNIWMDQHWIDEFLIWDPANFSGLTDIHIPSTKLWTPDLVLYNNAADFADNKMPALAMVKYNGQVFWPVPSKFKSSCKVDVTYFPFDVQTCHLKFGSWTYNGFQVDLNLHPEGIDLKSYLENGEWQLLSSKAERNVRTYSCCPEPYPDVKFYFTLQRRILYYVYHVIYPCILMSTLTLLVFCLPPDSGEKIALGITVLLAFSVLMLSIAEKLPETSESVPIISIYLTVVMSMTSVSVIFTVFVLNLHHPGPNKRPVPSWLRAIVFSRKKLVGDTRNQAEDEVTINNLSLKLTLENLVNELHGTEIPSEATGLILDSTPGPSRNTSDAREEEHRLLFQEQNNHSEKVLRPTQTSARYQRLSQIASASMGNNVAAAGRMTGDAGGVWTPFIAEGNAEGQLNPAAGGQPPRSRKVTSAAMQRTNREILRALRKIIEKHEQDDLETHLVDDWRIVAQYVDKILFWVYLCCTLASTIIILVVVPVFRILPPIHQKEVSDGNVTMTIIRTLP